MYINCDILFLNYVNVRLVRLLVYSFVTNREALDIGLLFKLRSLKDEYKHIHNNIIQ